jgi:hypothetical protein
MGRLFPPDAEGIHTSAYSCFSTRESAGRVPSAGSEPRASNKQWRTISADGVMVRRCWARGMILIAAAWILSALVVVSSLR